MIVISDEQIDVFDAATRGLFRQRLAVLIANQTNLEPFAAADRVLEHAQNFGVEQVFDIERLLRCLIVIGLDFWHHLEFAWAAEILGDAEMDGTTKVIQLEGQIALLLGFEIGEY